MYWAIFYWGDNFMIYSSEAYFKENKLSTFRYIKLLYVHLRAYCVNLSLTYIFTHNYIM